MYFKLPGYGIQITTRFYTKLQSVKYLTTLFTLVIHSIFFTSTTLSQESSGISTGKRDRASLSLAFANGISHATGRFSDMANDGFNFGLTLNKYFTPGFSLGLGVNYNPYSVRQGYEKIEPNQRTYWSNTSLVFAPQYTVNFGKFGMDLYAGAGFSFLNSPEIQEYYPNSELITTRFPKSDMMRNVIAKFGVNLKANLCNNMELFINSEYVSNVDNNLNIQSRDLSPAVNAAGFPDPDMAGEIPFENNSFKMSFVNISFGVRMDIGGKSKAQDHNSSRSNKSSSAIEQIDTTGSDGNKGGGTKVQDHNSSRSNKSSSAIDQIDNTGNDGNQGNGTKAQDHNSSRSNKSSSAIDQIDNTGNGGNQNGGTKVQDHNSSRSNKSSSAIDQIDNMGNDGNQGNGTKAQDHNSSRSNKSSSAIDQIDNTGNGGNQDGGTKVQDHNSSRSNKSGSK